MNKRTIVWAIVVLGLAFFVYLGTNKGTDGYDGVASGNGRIEATEINVATRVAGRLDSVWVNEGDFVLTGAKLAKLDTTTLEAELHQAQAQFKQAQNAINTAQSQVEQRRAEKEAAEALLQQRESELELARKRLARVRSLADQGSISAQEQDNAEAAVVSAKSAVAAAKSQIASSQAAITTSISQFEGARSAAEASQATIERIQTQIDDSTLLAPRDGRIQYVIARPGEVIGSGGRVVNMVDLSDVYMTFFLPTSAIGKISVGSEARIVLDSLPEYRIPARISFISDVAQFTPKTVETQEEREKLMFRVRASINKALLEKHLERVKTGLPGVAYVKFDATESWPQELESELD
ncbi:HlyD family secretion protein [Idiomarina sp. UBA4520]|uniref:HlyD family secretion protein n=1 Tax=Idiomarina sp. UBA4520 TaxID=1946647 RepID=UPI000A912AE0|nr:MULTISPECIES: HlyD family efflux transporter periplasmic adaptor subunit [unclassified Idiomarina]MBF38256.1 hemolysin D [Idiomarinaceae bacterium]|tara:strand:- start:71601 stop:72656 length:1056 start_codon:yes stop_codon:yes gene_type:complete